jgi:hypothetical protein
MHLTLNPRLNEEVGQASPKEREMRHTAQAFQRVSFIIVSLKCDDYIFIEDVEE